MSRRRSKDPTKAISITLKQSLLDKLDDKLTRTESRSAYIARALYVYIDHGSGLNIPTRQLMAMLAARINDETLKTVLLDRLTSGSSSSIEKESP